MPVLQSKSKVFEKQAAQANSSNVFKTLFYETKV